MKIPVSVTISFVILILVLSLFLYNVEQENKLYKTILYTETRVSEVSSDVITAEGYYNEASFYYEKQDYPSVESNCRLARDGFSKASQRYKDIESELESSKIKDPLIDTYKESLTVLSEIELNLYEACEHFESASRYYDTYYNTNVPSSDSSYDMGTGEIEAMNEKINLHDANVRKYNDLLSSFQTELKRRLE